MDSRSHVRRTPLPVRDRIEGLCAEWELVMGGTDSSPGLPTGHSMPSRPESTLLALSFRFRVDGIFDRASR